MLPPDLDISEPGLIAVVLQRDRAILPGLLGQHLVHGRHDRPALPDSRHRFWGVKRRIHHFHAIQPVLDAVAAKQDARVIELTSGTRRRLGRGDHVI